jgi:uracil-DNA glycosylase
MIARTDLTRYRLCFSNLVCCIPLDEEGQETEEPPPESIECCAPRLREFVGLVKPSVIICVGRVAEVYASSFVGDTPWVPIVHPAAILKSNYASQGLTKQRCVVHLKKIVENYLVKNGIG